MTKVGFGRQILKCRLLHITGGSIKVDIDDYEDTSP